MNGQGRILLVEDKQAEREALGRLLRMEGYDIVMTASAEEAIEVLGSDTDLIVSDLRLGKETGIDLLRYARERGRQIPFIMITACDEVDSAVEAMKLGADDYLSKPVNPDELLMVVKRCLDAVEKTRTIEQLSERLDRRAGFENMIGNSKRMLTLFDQARRAAKVDTTVLIVGESGTGKELVAEGVHHHSPRRKGPFVTVNMAAVPEHLVESELFGHVKGAFTGAMDARIGRFEAANKGTLFIDEIGDFALASQAKLLRVLETHVVTPIGCNDDRKVDVRVVAATSRNLEEMVAKGEFREDLYYRLNIITLPIPPLRERRDDIPLLVAHFVKRLCKQQERDPLTVSPDLMEVFQQHQWPGNVRQLRNTLESMIVMAQGDTLTANSVPGQLDNKASANHSSVGVEVPAGVSLEDLERAAVEQTLTEHHGNRTHTAEALGISLRTLQRKLKAWEIE